MFYSGIDQHKRDSFITTYDDGGAIVNQERVPNTTLRIQRYFAQFPGPHKAVVESTGSWYWLADHLRGLNVELSLAHATRLKAISAAKVKTDKVDSDILCAHARTATIQIDTPRYLTNIKLDGCVCNEIENALMWYKGVPVGHYC